jgi:hypothetical protein
LIGQTVREMTRAATSITAEVLIAMRETVAESNWRFTTQRIIIRETQSPKPTIN